MHTNTLTTPVARRSAGVGSFNLFGALRRWLTYRETVGELRKLSPRQLRDIGVEADVEEFAWKLSNR